MSSKRRGLRQRQTRPVEETALYKKGDLLLIPLGDRQWTGPKTWAMGPVVNIWGTSEKPVYQVLLGHPKGPRTTGTWEASIEEQHVILAIKKT